ncbi:MAG: hypothetical protein LBV18_04280 [Alistipes sp.]|jgi:hypothetical protein|nr:hypothetical protein [Alistipes sp.]
MIWRYPYTTLNLAEKRMDEALHKIGFARKPKRVGGNPVYVWLIRKITPNPFNEAINDTKTTRQINELLKLNTQ